jgi:hypothetical protein
MLKDIVPGAASSSPSLLTAVGGQLYFYATEPSTGGAVEERRHDFQHGSGPDINPRATVVGQFQLPVRRSTSSAPSCSRRWPGRDGAVAQWNRRWRVSRKGHQPRTSARPLRPRVGDGVFFTAWASGLGWGYGRQTARKRDRLVMDIAPGLTPHNPQVLRSRGNGVLHRRRWREWAGAAKYGTAVSTTRPGPESWPPRQQRQPAHECPGNALFSANDGRNERGRRQDGRGHLGVGNQPRQLLRPWGLPR